MHERIGQKINKEEGWSYFIDNDGHVCKMKENADSRLLSLLIIKDVKNLLTDKEKNLLLELSTKEAMRAQREKIIVSNERIKREKGYIYLIDKDGYPARIKLVPKESKKPFVKAEEAKSHLSTNQKIMSPNHAVSKEALMAYKKTLYKKAAGRHILYGLVIVIFGIVVTIASYELAPPGGIFIVASGAIMVGIYYFFKGIYYYIKSITIKLTSIK